MDKEKKQNLKRMLLSLVFYVSVFVAIFLLIVYVNRCVGFLACGVFLASSYIHSWFFDKKFKARFVDPSFRTLNIVLCILAIVMFCLCAWVFCS